MYAGGPNNLTSLMLQGSLSRSNAAVKQALERLSTGKRINRASDDVAGMMVASQMKSDHIRLTKQIESAERHNHLLAAKDGALGVLSDLAIDLEGLVVAAGNRKAMSQAELKAMQQQATSILDTFDFLAANSKFNDELLLKGFDSRSLGLRRVSDGQQKPDLVRTLDGLEGDGEPGGQPASGPFFDLVAGNLEAIQEAVRNAGERISSTRAGARSLMNQNGSMMRQWMAELEATAGELSRIEDADYAVEVSRLVRGQVLQQASIWSLGKQQEQAWAVLMLLR